MLICLKCNVLHLTYREFWIEGQRFLEPYTLTYEDQCDSKSMQIFHFHKIQRQLRILPFFFFFIFKKLVSIHPELFGDFFPPCFMALEELFIFFVSFLYDLTVINVK